MIPITETLAIIAWCDSKNRENGKVALKWFHISPEDNPDSYVGIHPCSSILSGPAIRVGQRYHIVYTSPVRLPFKDPDQPDESAVFHVAEITGKLETPPEVFAPGDPFVLTGVEVVVCLLDDYSVRTTAQFTKSVFRLFLVTHWKQSNSARVAPVTYGVCFPRLIILIGGM